MQKDPYRSAIPYSRAVGAILAPFLVSRGGVLLAGLAASIVSNDWRPPNPPSLWRVAPDPLHNLLARWDTFWYFDIAANGYRWNGNPAEQQNVVFFPLLPALMRIGGRALGGHPLLFGLLLSLAAFLFALAYLWKWTASRYGDQVASAAVALLCAFPFSIFFSVVYTESIFLLAVIGAWYHTERHDWLPASLFGLAAGLTRPNGFLIAIPLAFSVFNDHLDGRLDARSIRLAAAVVLAPFAGVALYSAYLGVSVGAPLAWIQGQQAWPTYAPWGGRGQIDPGDWPGEPWNAIVQVANAAALALVLASIGGIGRRIGIGAAIWIVLSILLPAARHGLQSLGRFTSVLFPIFVWLAIAGAGRRRLLIAFAIGQIVAAILFFTWRPLV